MRFIRPMHLCFARQAHLKSIILRQNMEPLIRPCNEADVPQMLLFIKDLAEFEREPDAVYATVEKLRSTLGFAAGSTAFARALVAETRSEDAQGKLCAMAIYFYNYSTWHAAPGIWLEDLYVAPDARHKGVGSRLIAALAAEVVQIGGRRLEWCVLKWNRKAIDVYQSSSIDAEMMNDWVTMRVDGEKLQRLAHSARP